MDPKRKKIYIGLIVGCLIASAVILWSGFHTSGGNVDETNTPIISVENPTDSTTGIDIGSRSTGPTNFGIPQVFPANKEFKTKVLESADFKKLKPYQNVDPNPLGRPDPFRTY